MDGLAEREGFEPPGLAAGRFHGGCNCPLCHRSGAQDNEAAGGDRPFLCSGGSRRLPPLRRGARAAEWGALLRR
jgi:hypothetical protein